MKHEANSPTSLSAEYAVPLLLLLLLLLLLCMLCDAGAVDSTLLEASDILPTVADLAGLVPAAVTNISNNNRADATTAANDATAAVAAARAAAAAAQLIKDKPWDGISFKNLLLTNNTVTNRVTNSSSSSGRSYRGNSLSTQQQLERYVFSVSAHCWSPDAVPRLGKNR
jgi:O-antigen ligase